jgi:tRNA 5-methylaminomethyl-2-thiouridine biosynthesis bifunctional protein
MASEIAGVPLAGGGVFFEQGGWVQPPQLVAAQLAQCTARAGDGFVAHFHREVAALRRMEGRWQAMDAAGTVIARAPVVVVAGGASADVAQWFGQTEWPIESVRGALTVLDGAALAAPRVPVHRDGYVLPAIDGRIVTGASYERAGVLEAGAANRENLRRLAGLLQLPDVHALMPLAQSRSAGRAVARDRLPVIGALPDAAALTHALVTRKGVRLADLPRLPGAYVAGAYGSRGLTWAALGAEMLACRLEGEAAPLEGALQDAVDPARFAFRALRREMP